VNQKKCPKCGENNPPEAVMCWACYTPLTGGAAAGAAAPAGRGAAPAAESGEEKAKPPVWQMAVIAGGLLGALFLGASSMGLIGGSGGGGESPPDLPPETGAVPSPDNPAPPAPPPAPAPATDGGNPAPAPAFTAPFAVVTQPNPRAAIGIMAIIPTSKTLPPEKAASLAAFTYRQVVDPNRWPVFQIFVFNNDKAAAMFKDYQIKQRGAPLDDSDYRQLSNIWPNVYVRYEYRRSGKGGVETVRYPFKDPMGWWYSKSS
jgi:hypothetical protein